jgi:DNA-binding XRE family transcriptional regulator
MATKQHRLNYEDLRRFTGATTQTQLAQILGARDATIVDWKTKGVPEVTADNIAIKLGVHPSAIWGDAWFALADQILAV